MNATVLTAMVMHETNTFSTRRTDLDAFAAFVLTHDNGVVDRFRGTRTGLGAAFECAERYGWQLRHPIAASATPSGVVTRPAFEAILAPILAAAPGSDGALLFLHGAMVLEDEEDGEGELLERLRAVMGDKPVIAILDLHANATERMAANANALISYRTYPHIDGYERMHQGGALLDRAMRGEVRPVCRLVQPPQLEGLDHGRTASVPDDSPMLRALADADAVEAAGQALVVSLQAGFSSADIRDVGPSVAVTTDGDPDAALTLAQRFATWIWQTRDYDSLKPRLLTIADAVARAKAEEAGATQPLVIADYADNPGGGAYMDATALLAAMIAADLQEAALHAILDPAAVQAGLAAGPGADVTLQLGGHTDPRFGGGPLTVTGRVIALTDGSFVARGPMGGGARYSHGPSMTLRIGGIDVVVVSHPTQTKEVEQFITMGIDPRAAKTLAVKSMQHFRAAFEPIARAVVVVDSGALCSPIKRASDFTRTRQPLYPFAAATFG
ncbi:MAG: M81 family peptidase [Alphaproteobacteria bacterium]|nr:MAG: M81 family peptidase [Alphaproteobacteria bacterium]